MSRARKAARSPGGRLAIPLLAVLDDAANVVRWRDFPQRSGQCGGRGIVVMTMLQSWAQGVRCWGRGGMDELWSAATIKVLGGGVDDIPHLRDRPGVPDLRSLPRGRAVLLASGVPPVLIETEPWWDGEYAAAIHDSAEPVRPPIADVPDDPEEASDPSDAPGSIQEVRPL
ncbi:TraM recognition domain-containing protein [Nocardia crassostreae]|uniref:TraM recognition domain-containing protein n=1 Tax=Nocardia crassostreae TaxID=53428 RepID=UPI00082EDAA9|nr:TraM recognition domain-containing protein [Nocardia crassostreae]